MRNIVFSHIKRSWSHHSSTLLATIIAMSLVLCALSTVLLARQNLVMMANAWGQDSELTAYLEESLSDKQVAALEKEIKKIPDVQETKYISKTESAKRFLKRMGHLSPDFLDDKRQGDNPLPATLDIQLRSDAALGERVEVLQSVAEKVTQLSGVQDVSFGQGWMAQWSKFVTKFNLMTLGFIAVVLLLGLLVIGNATRISLQSRRDEIEIMELVGATASWIRGPFLIEGAVVGLVSACLSLLISGFLNQALFGYMSESGWMWVSSNQLSLSMSASIFVLCIGTTFGALGAYLCVRRLNSGWSAGAALE